MTDVQGGPGLEREKILGRVEGPYKGVYFGMAHYGSETHPKGDTPKYSPKVPLHALEFFPSSTGRRCI